MLVSRGTVGTSQPAHKSQPIISHANCHGRLYTGDGALFFEATHRDVMVMHRHAFPSYNITHSQCLALSLSCALLLMSSSWGAIPHAPIGSRHPMHLNQGSGCTQHNHDDKGHRRLSTLPSQLRLIQPADLQRRHTRPRVQRPRS